MPAYAGETSNLAEQFDKSAFEYTLDEYEEILPFKINLEDRKIVAKLFTEIGIAFEKNDLKEADIKLKAFYSVIGKYWTSENTLKTLLPFGEMMKFGGSIMTPEQKENLEIEFKKLATLRSKNDLEAYFDQIKKIHGVYYMSIGQNIGDTNNELQLIQYIKGADLLTPEDLQNYTFKDYLEILPFDISDEDFVKGEMIFKNVIEELKANNLEKAKLHTSQLNNLLAPYWIKKSTLNLLISHKENEENLLQYMSRKDRIEINNAYESVVKARETKDFDAFFLSIDTYYHLIGQAIKNMYTDIFDEIVFIRS